MDENQAKEEIRLIREMLDKTRKSTANAGPYILFWGILIILAVIGNYVLVFLEKYSWIWVNWAFFPGIGVVYSFLYWARQGRKQGTKTYAQVAAGYLGCASGIAFVLMGLVFPALGLYSYGVISVLMATIFGTFVFVAGGIFEWNLLKWCGVLWWLGALGMIFIKDDYRALAFVPLLLVGYMLPGFILHAEHKKAQRTR